jgi:hypothetical protein
MAEPSVRRNPVRNSRNRARRHPDSPVSFVLPPLLDISSDEESESSNTDTELARDLTSSFEAAARAQAVRNYMAMNDGRRTLLLAKKIETDGLPEVIEVRDSPSPVLQTVALASDNGGKSTA